MKKTLLATLLIAGFAASAAAEESPPPLTANVSLVSSYRFRGIDQTYGKPALLYDLKCTGSQAYLKLASEIIQRERRFRAVAA